MLDGHPHIALYRPEIPQNTGSIARLAAATACRLHLVLPLGFQMGDRNLRRPGLDYWPYLDLELHDELEQLLALFPGKFAFLSKKATRPYTAIPQDTQLLVFGQETAGFPDSVHERYADSFFGIPMFHPEVRSLNLANAVSIVLYDRLLRAMPEGHGQAGLAAAKDRP